MGYFVRVIYYIDMVILDFDMGYGLMIWEMTVSTALPSAASTSESVPVGFCNLKGLSTCWGGMPGAGGAGITHP
jgi:hypothetical protein